MGEDPDLFDDCDEVVLDSGDDAGKLVQGIVALAADVGEDDFDGFESVFIARRDIDHDIGGVQGATNDAGKARVDACGQIVECACGHGVDALVGFLFVVFDVDAAVGGDPFVEKALVVKHSGEQIVGGAVFRRLGAHPG